MPNFRSTSMIQKYRAMYRNYFFVHHSRKPNVKFIPWLFGICLILSGHLAQAKTDSTNALLQFLHSPQAQLGLFEELQAPANLRQDDHLILLRKAGVVQMEMPQEGQPKGKLRVGDHELEFMIDQLESGGNYFVFSSDSLFDQFIEQEFPNLTVVWQEEQSIKSYSYRDKKEGTTEYKLELVLQQIGIVPEAGGNLEYGKLPNLRDALGSSIIQWLLGQKSATLVLMDGQFKAMPGNAVTTVQAPEKLLVARYQVGGFVKVTEDRSQMLGMLLGMLLGGAVMTLVLMMGRKRKKQEVGETDTGRKEELEGQLSEVELVEMKKAVAWKNEILKRVPKSKIERLGANLDRVLLAFQSGDANETMAATADLLDQPVPTIHFIDGEGKDTLGELANSLELKLAAWKEVEGKADQEIIAQAAILEHMLESLRTAFDLQKMETGIRFADRMEQELPGQFLAGLAIIGLKDRVPAANIRKKIAQLQSEMEERGMANDAPGFVRKSLLPLLDRLTDQEIAADVPDPVTDYFELLRERFGNLSGKLGQMQDPPSEEEAETFMSNLFQAALHLNDFIQVYLDAPHSSSTRQNQRLILEKKQVKDLGAEAYETFTEAISMVPLNVRNFRYLASAAGVRTLDQVLLDGYHIPSTALRPNR